MCSFLVLSENKRVDKKVYTKLKFRGPDNTTVFRSNGYKFIHNQLFLCGEDTIQPFFNNGKEIVALFNGEIYNYKEFGDYKSDGECIIDLYLKYGKSFVSRLDGEFLIILFDFKKNVIIQSSDVFGTKPSFYSHNGNEIIFSSLESTLSEILNGSNFCLPKKNKPNKCITIDMDNNFKIVDEFEVHKFDLNQHKNTFDDWNIAFENSIKKRVGNNDNNVGVFITLSSGYDSGTISCALEKLQLQFESYTIRGSENVKIINERTKNHKNHFHYLTQTEFNSSRCEVKTLGEHSNIELRIDDGIEYYDCNDDPASVGLHYLFKEARNNNSYITLSGQGADEIFSDYGYEGESIIKDGYLAGTINGKFPNELNLIFPWFNFYHGYNSAFIAKEESIASLHGVETRYPYLDTQVVQEFLWLTSELKNKYYKSPLHNYMKENSYSFDLNLEWPIKHGFKPDVGLRHDFGELM
jgi:asparagine synthase (glutamine-hydrolysing)